MSLPAAWVDQLFARLATRYGAAFMRQWPDADPAGANYAKQVAALALAVGAVSVEVLDLSFLGAS